MSLLNRARFVELHADSIELNCNFNRFDCMVKRRIFAARTHLVNFVHHAKWHGGQLLQGDDVDHRGDAALAAAVLVVVELGGRLFVAIPHEHRNAVLMRRSA